MSRAPTTTTTRLGGTHTFYELDLTTGPADVVGNAMLTAKSDIAEAYQKLMWIPYGAVHAELMPIFNQANAEYYAGATGRRGPARRRATTSCSTTPRR